MNDNKNTTIRLCIALDQSTFWNLQQLEEELKMSRSALMRALIRSALQERLEKGHIELKL